MYSQRQNTLFNEKQDFSDVSKEEEHKCIKAENLSTFLLTPKTQNQAHVSFKSEDMHLVEEHNCGKISNKTEQCREPEQLNILPVEVIYETEQQGQNQGSSELEETFCKEKQRYHCVPHREAQQHTWPQNLNVTSSQTQDITFQKNENEKAKITWTLNFSKRRVLRRCQMQRSISQWKHSITLWKHREVKEQKENPICEKTDD